jgi:hypothetical protein
MLNMLQQLNSSFLTQHFVNNGVEFKPSTVFGDLLKSKNELDKEFELPEQRETDTKYQYSNASYISKVDYANVGWSLAIGDFNIDQIDDIAIGAPVYSQNNEYQNGRVYIRLSSKDGLVLQDLDLDQSSDFIIDPSDKNSRFGHALTILDLNQDGFDDLVVSAPSAGLKNLTYNVKISSFIISC